MDHLHEVQLTSEPEPTTEHLPPKRGALRVMLRLVLLGLLLLLLAGALLYSWVQTANQPPEGFPVGEPIEISPGMNVREITELLAERGVVRSNTLLYYLVVLFHDPSTIKASTYYFDQPLTATAVATRLTEGDFTADLIRFTHIEGERVTQLAKRAELALPAFDAATFVAAAEPHEGKLYPDTYFVPASFTADDLRTLMLDTFSEKIAPYESAISTHPLDLDEILVLASIIEREANSPESKRLVSSVLQNRLEIGMALQADASIEYVLDKPLAELTPADLEIDTPYNTYLYPGLPPTPIGNPGLEAILAVLEPAESDYFYYITDDTGVFHYAKTYNEHLRNIERYLR